MAKTNGSTARPRPLSAAAKAAKIAKAVTAKAAAPKQTAGKTTRGGKAPRLPKSVAGAVKAALAKQASDVVLLDLRKADSFTDFFVICTANSSRQIRAIADGVIETLKQDHNERPAMAEGVDKSEWVLLDYFNFVVHIFSRDCRAFYDLERLWGNADRHEFDDTEPAGARPLEQH